MKPSAVQLIHPIVCEQKEQPPHEQHAIVDDGTPEQCLPYHLKAHAPSPMCLFPLRTGLLDRLCYVILPTGSASSKPIKASLVERQFHGWTACAARLLSVSCRCHSQALMPLPIVGYTFI